MVLVTHDRELADMADARLVLRDGRVVENTIVSRPDPAGVAPGASADDERRTVR